MTDRSPTAAFRAPAFAGGARASRGDLPLHRCGVLVLGLVLGALPAAADPSPALMAVLRACTTPDLTHADRIAALDAAGGAPLDGDARLQASRAMQVGWLLLDNVAADTITPADLPALFATADADAAREAGVVADGPSIPSLDWRSLDDGAVQVQVFQTASTRTTCVIVAPTVDLSDLAAVYPPVLSRDYPPSPLGTVTILEAEPGVTSRFVEVFQPEIAAIAAEWPGPVPATFLRLFNIPTTKAP